MEETAVVSLTWLFILLTPCYFVPISCVAWFSDVRGGEAKGTANDLGRLRIRLLVVQSNLHTLVVLSFFFYYGLRQKELGKNWPDQQNWAMNLNRLCKETLQSGFWRWRIKRTVCLFRFQNMWPQQSNSPTKTWGRQRHEIFWTQRLCWLVKFVNTNLPWSQFLTLVIQGFKTLVMKELFFRHNLVFSLFSEVFSSVKPSLWRKLISRVCWDGFKVRTQT